jgi:hypothetical protein
MLVLQHEHGSVEDGAVTKLVADLELSIKAEFSALAVRTGIL